MEISVGVFSAPGDPEQAQRHECRTLLQHRITLSPRPGKGRQRDARLDAQGQQRAPVPRRERLQRFAQQCFCTTGLNRHEFVKCLGFFPAQDIRHRDIEVHQIFKRQGESIMTHMQTKPA